MLAPLLRHKESVNRPGSRQRSRTPGLRAGLRSDAVLRLR